MKLGVTFGTADTKEVIWYRPLDDFPKLVNYLSRNYEWVFYDQDPTGRLDAILMFTELPSYDPNYKILCPTWADLFPIDLNGCVCGAKYSSFSWDHMKFCHLWRKW